MLSGGAIQLDLVLLGGGHAQVAVLKSFAMRPLPGLRITVVTDVLLTPYSGMLPAFVEGLWRHSDMHIDLVKLAERAGARLIHARCIGLNPEKKQLFFKNRPAIGYDVLSINSGAAPALSEISGADAHGIPVKPISGFVEKLHLAGNPKGAVALVGGGAASVELGLALRSYFQNTYNTQPEMHIISRSDRLLPQFPKRAHTLSQNALNAADITTYLGVSAEKFDEDTIYLSDGRQIAADLKFLVTPAKPPDWLKQTGLSLDKHGYISVNNSLQTDDYPDIFASGDVASIKGYAREKAGVFAVRSGPYLVHNLRAFITGKALRRHIPQKRYLALLGLADGTAIAVRGGLVFRSRFYFWLKQWIDKRFIEKFTNLPEMPVAYAERLKLAETQTDKADPAFDTMRCLGCGAKTGPDSLRLALSKACETAKSLGADSAFLPDINSLSDSASFQLPTKDPQLEIVQSIDSLSQMVSDPYIFGRIAALHALSDIFVAGGKPVTALAQIQLSFARQDIQQDALISMLTGALMELSHARVKLVGGHTSEGHDTTCGFSILGVKSANTSLLNTDSCHLIITKPIGIGMSLAAQMRGEIGGESYNLVIQTMLQSNQTAAEILRAYDGAQMTDVTGFGLARHSATLLSQTAFPGAEIWLDAIPTLPDVKQLIDKQIFSSLHGLNAKNLPLEMPNRGNQYQILFDPQTAGGVLAFVPAVQSSACLKALNDAGYQKAAIIGKTIEGNGLVIYENMPVQ